MPADRAPSVPPGVSAPSHAFSAAPAAPALPLLALHRAYLAAHHDLARDADFSARAVLVPDPALAPGECGLPRSLALRLFFFHLVGELVDERSAPTPAAALALLTRATGLAPPLLLAPPFSSPSRASYPPFLLPLLERVVTGHPLLVSRGEMLDRSGIQSFLPVLVDGDALRLSPLAMIRLVPDGREVTIALPLSGRARRESIDRMSPPATLRSPVHGGLTLSLSPEALAGLYHLTHSPPHPPPASGPRPRHFASSQEAAEAFARGELRAGDTVRVGRGEGRHEATAGRCVAASLVPQLASLEAENQPWGLWRVRRVLDQVAQVAGDEAAAEAARALERLGTDHATRSGLSLGIDDLIEPSTRAAVLAESHANHLCIQEMYDEGQITDGERYCKILDLWSQATDRIASQLGQQLDGSAAGSPLAVMVCSGAVESGIHAARKLGGMVGLVAKTSDEIVERPVLGSLRRGLDAHELFLMATSGRGLRIRTGGQEVWLRQLADLLRGVSVVTEDCQTPTGLWVRALDDFDPPSPTSLRGRIAGRVVVREISSVSLERTLLAPAGVIPTTDQLDAIDREGPRAIEVRSAVGCEARGGLCAACTGARLGDPVGMRAAQALVVASSQLRRRLFPVKEPGVRVLSFGGSIERLPAFRALGSGRMVLRRGDLARQPDGSLIVVSPDAEFVIERADGEIVQRTEIPHATTLLVAPGGEVRHGRLLAQSPVYEHRALSDRQARVSVLDLVDHVTMIERVDEITGLSQRRIVDPSQSFNGPLGVINPAVTRARYLHNPALALLRPRLVLTTAEGIERVIPLAEGSLLKVADGDEVERGQLLVVRQLPWSTRWRNPFRGPELVRLLDLRPEPHAAVLTEIAGTVSIEGQWGERVVVVTPDFPVIPPRRYPVAGSYLNVTEGERVLAGAVLVDGPISPASILAVSGRPEAAAYLVDLLLDILWMGGAQISSEHVELVVAAMLRQVRVTCEGAGPWKRGELVDRVEFSAQAARLATAGERAPEAEPAIVGVAAGARAIRRRLRGGGGRAPSPRSMARGS
jgi:DNA-directed RNA polymerase subunit beta'